MGVTMLSLFNAQLRGVLPVHPPYGAVVEQDGPFIRTHYGTSGTVDHGPLPSAAIHVGERLSAAGFVPGWQRTVLAAAFSQLRPAGMISQPVGRSELAEVAELAARSGPHRLPFGEFMANGGHFGGARSDIRVIKVRGRPIWAAAWGEYFGQFLSIGGVADPQLEYVLRLCAWHPAWFDYPPVYVVVEADGELRTALQDAGLRPITTVTTGRTGFSSSRAV